LPRCHIDSGEISGHQQIHQTAQTESLQRKKNRIQAPKILKNYSYDALAPSIKNCFPWNSAAFMSWKKFLNSHIQGHIFPEPEFCRKIWSCKALILM
jgi:hypothetical protein